MKPRILFLDFDGVLHPCPGNGEPDFCRAQMLAECLAEHSVDIWISSSWRDSHSIEQLKQLLPPAIARRVRGALGPDVRARHCRYETIMAVVNSLPGTIDWRALDDSLSEFPEGCANLIACDARTGFDANAAQRLAAWLRSDERA